MCFLGFDNYIIHISLDEVVFYLVFEVGLYGALVGSPGVLEPKRHGRVVVGAEGRDEGCLDLVVLFESDLVITRVAIEKGNSSQPAVESTTSPMRGKPKGSLGQCLLRSV